MRSSVLKNKYIAALIIFLFSFLIYLPSLQHDFVWDDVIEIKKNYFKFEKTSLLKKIFPEKKPKQTRGYYRPVTYYSLGYDYKIWNENPFGFHLTNVLLNAINSILVLFLFLLILKRFEIGDKELIAFFSALLFTIHPMHVESVSWIAGRTDIICSLFFIAAFISHIKSYDRVYFLIFTCLLFYLSLLSKELAVAFPFTVLAYDLIADKKIKKQTLTRFALYILFLAIYITLKSRGGTPIAKGLTSEVATGGTGLVKYIFQIKTLFVTYLFYFYKLLIPFWFSSFISSIPRGSFYLITSFISFGILGYTFLYSVRKKSGFKGFCILWLLLALGPSTLVAISYVSVTPLAERYLYLPIAPFALLVAFLIYKLSDIKRYRTAAIAIFCAIFLVLGFLTIVRQAAWQDRVTFWADASRNTDSSVPLINYGMALIDNKRPEEGIEEIRRGLSKDKKSTTILRAAALNNIGIAYMNLGKGQQAHDAFLEAIEENENFYKSYYHLGIIYYATGKRQNSRERLEKSLEYYSKAINLKKSYARAYLGIARIYVELGELNNAKQFARQALSYGLGDPLDKQAEKIINSNQP